MWHKAFAWLQKCPRWLAFLSLGVVIFIGLALVTSSATYGLAQKFNRPASFTRLFLDHTGRWLPWALLVPVIAALDQRWPFRRDRWLKPLGLHLLLSVGWLPPYLFLIIAFEVLRGNFGWEQVPVEFQAYFGFNIFGDYHWYWVIYIGISAWRYGQELIQQQRKTAALLLKNTRLQKDLAEARLGILKAQMQPHFLYNTHNTIGALIREGQAEEALEVLHLLSRLLRRSLESDMQRMVTLDEELTFLNHYLAIQKMRFPERLKTTSDISDEAKQALLPAMILQPLVENAVHHGVVSAKEGDTIEISAGVASGKLTIRILNQTRPGTVDTGGFGIGLKNTRSRLQHHYGDAQSLELEYLDGHTIAATMVLPFRK